MKRILVAEDDIVVRKLYQLHFLRNQIRGVFFTTGEGVIQGAKDNPPDLVILDFELPGHSGPEILRELQQTPGCEHVPVIFVTGRATPALVEELREAGVQDVFGKPFSPIHLMQRIIQLTATQTE